MARVAITESYLEDIADAIREKTGLSEETYTPSEMAPAIMTISGSGGITPAGTININTNGTHNVTNYASANVSVPNSYSNSDEGKVVSSGALVAQSSATYTENGTYDTTLKNSVTVDVEGSGSGTDNNLIITVSWNSTAEQWQPNVSITDIQTAATGGKNIIVDANVPSDAATADGDFDDTYDRFVYWVHEFSDDSIKEYSYVYDTNGITLDQYNAYEILNLQAKTNISPSTSSQTITADSEYNGLSSVQINAMPSGTAGTPSASKGTVSNHSISVTPSVTNVTGYITGGTKTGTAVSVSASELVSGNKEITSNGTGIDVANYSTVSVSVSGGTEAVSVVDTTDTAGGTIRTITAVDISDTTATAADVASGKYFYTAAGVKTAGTGSGGSSDLSWLTSNTVTPSVRNFFYALINGTIEHGEFSLSDTPTSFVTAFTMTNFGESNLPQGIIIIDKDFYQGITTLANQSSEAFAFCWMDKAFTKPSDDSSDPPAYNAFRSMVNQNGTNASVGKITFDGSTASFRAKWQFSGNSLQVKHDYANNNQYCAFMRNRTYIWMAY